MLSVNECGAAIAEGNLTLDAVKLLQQYLQFKKDIMLEQVRKRDFYGILMLTFQNCQKAFWVQNREKISLILNAVAVFLFIISSQVYAGAFLFIFLIIKALMLVKWQ